jgi:regulator of protease activity HflC (stomatin/prohibitin superfamily)
MDPGAVVLAVLLALVATALKVRRGYRLTTVFEHQRALRFVGGRFADERGPGRYWHSRRTTHWVVDTRSTMLTVAGQEAAPSADGVAVRASLLATYRIADVRKAMLGSSSYATALHGYLQLALRTVITSHPTEELLTDRRALDPQLLAASRESVAVLGIELESVAIRDLGLSAELKRAFADVIKARQEGLGALERARGETAALRNLANAAQSLERNPALFQLRLLHAIGQQPGARVVLNVPAADGASTAAPPTN